LERVTITILRKKADHSKLDADQAQEKGLPDKNQKSLPNEI
jgi:hypothetical protein